MKCRIHNNQLAPRVYFDERQKAVTVNPGKTATLNLNEAAYLDALALAKVGLGPEIWPAEQEGEQAQPETPAEPARGRPYPAQEPEEEPDEEEEPEEQDDDDSEDDEEQSEEEEQPPRRRAPARAKRPSGGRRKK